MRRLMLNGFAAFAWCAACLPAHAAASPRINEVLAANTASIEDEDGDSSDWIELHNHGPAVNLRDWGLSDGKADPFKWRFPGVTINSNQFLIVWASGKDRRTPGAPLHANFRIDSDGDALYLTDAAGGAVDSAPAASLPPDISFGRTPDGTGAWAFFAAPTPGAANTTAGFAEALFPPAFSHTGGMYTDALLLAMSSTATGAVIRYTLDGSEPTAQSPVFTNGSTLLIKSRRGDSNSIAMIKTSPYWKPTTGELFKATVVRARAFKPQSITSRIATHTFFVDPAIRGMYSFPVISLATTASNFFDYNRGIYVPGVYFNPGNDRWTGNYFQRGDAWERPIHLEWFETNGAAAFSLDAGARINGALTRNIPAKCLRVFARDTYGTSWIKHPVFPGGGASAFKRLLLRTGGNEYAGSFLSDVIAEEAFNHTSIDFHRYRPAILFVNGEYWGIHNVCEYLNKHYLQTKYGFTDAQIEQFDIIEGVGAGYATSGNMAHYTAMLRCIETNILANNHALSPGTYAHVRTQMDVDNYIDYMAAEIYACNYDWPGNNVELWRLRTNSNATAAAGHDGRWRWFYYDLDASLGGGWNAAYTASYDSVAHATRFDSNDVYKGLAPISSPTLPGPFGRGTYLFRALLTNPQFKYAFVNRLADHMNTSFRRERMAALVDALKAQYQVEMTNHIVRWLAPSSISSWVTRVNRTRDFVTGRPPHIYQFVISNFALPGAADVVLDVSAATAGCIRINSLVIDTNTVGVTGMPYPWTGTYFRGIPMTISAVPRERHRFRQWAGLPGVTSAVATVILVSNLAITAEFDVYTNPPAISADALVFPAAPCEIMPATWTNIVWQPDRIHDAVSGTQCFLTVCLVNASDGAVQDVIATNAPNGLASAAWWPALRLVREDPYCIRLDARSQAGTMNSRTFTASPVYVIPEPAFALVALVFLCLRTQPPRTLTNDQCQMSNAQCPIAVRLSPPSLRRLPRRIS